jgi:hypothetical protein
MTVIDGQTVHAPQPEVNLLSAEEQDFISQKFGEDNGKLAKSYVNQYNETQKIMGQNNELKERVKAYEAVLNGQRPSPAALDASRQTKTPVELLGEALVPVGPLQQLIMETVASELRPLLDGVRARNSVASRYPEFSKYEGEFNTFLEANPELKSRYDQGMQAGGVSANNAYELAWHWYAESARSKQRPLPPVQDSMRTDASIPGGGMPPSAAQSLSIENMQEQIEGGNIEAVLAARLGALPSFKEAEKFRDLMR